MDLDDPWEDDPHQHDHSIREQEWTKISDSFTNSGYREGIIAGKEASLQEGFDDGFASVGAPLGRQLGLLRGTASALLSYLSSSSHEMDNNISNASSSALEEARTISAALADIRLSDIAPRDLEAEEHAREHLQDQMSDEPSLPAIGEMEERKKMEQLEDMLNQLTAGSAIAPDRTVQDVAKLTERLDLLARSIGLNFSV
ncbi:hypothetical protein CONPUDRAFT_56374 [Coniophora puteana RWD-64-598 SS2]|uniref:Protein YAE1 n=1 Tax=Coniophora puteana (strain RWD-64-598) TaxID=741705 RepID=A0A5M3MQ41_CONPW|nr:uncharacterized protein CONPUDRAFT_56374 [Coniophora puteana RWD-64-598 SS2]EIW81298.1 hypothetical protein CONPUDRAFT_56374 [Coniophora puteana RWD-64-598 SS2]